jgi:hypothetical protein
VQQLRLRDLRTAEAVRGVRGRLIPVNPDWPEIIWALRRSGLRDKDIFDKLADQGVVAHHSALHGLRTRRIGSPHYETGAALMNLYAEVIKPR